MSEQENRRFKEHEGGCCGPARAETGARRAEPQVASIPHIGQDDDCCGGHGQARPAPQNQRRSGGCGCH